ncbi:uncharacterized protein Z520_10271 [Fonsecaea multimorphosa CBS 102226]|uniref:Pyridoxal phosphate homeostasis protein n=1 Tax=Fonsecaea multimorphosa CBS 102226 TaxID=1442371 RepID=A0A0D2JU09_9EURO|nr:uncharacterized protein Z520_10271 [Fonsecaea multimorphosa CBS 102226]KIX93934.1 hypothetical protein Z520_10271 [Fonsecaea multimorphosa CBS 102226]OAL19282.1 hypothetical protein AYO22_09826 [Fonsecaea multimorphosa]
MSSSNDTTAPPSDMKITINPQRAAALLQNLSSVQQRVQSAWSSSLSPGTSPSTAAAPVRVVAVSKLKPASDILALHHPAAAAAASSSSSEESASTQQSQGQGGHDHFGENYVQELVEKSRVLPKTIKWHFIGGLQSNKCVPVARDVDNLWAVESVDSEKKANLLNKGRAERNERLRKEHGQQAMDENGLEEKLRIFIQVNTSGEESKSGLDPDSPELLSLARLIRDDGRCPNLHLQGLMTIGAIARSKATTPETENEDFITLRSTRDKLAADLGLQNKDELELSMGMSEDFESAVRLGSSEVRVGSTIFGERPPKKDAKVLEQTEQEKN